MMGVSLMEPFGVRWPLHWVLKRQDTSHGDGEAKKRCPQGGEWTGLKAQEPSSRERARRLPSHHLPTELENPRPQRLMDPTFIAALFTGAKARMISYSSTTARCRPERSASSQPWKAHLTGAQTPSWEGHVPTATRAAKQLLRERGWECQGAEPTDLCPHRTAEDRARSGGAPCGGSFQRMLAKEAPARP